MKQDERAICCLLLCCPSCRLGSLLFANLAPAAAPWLQSLGSLLSWGRRTLSRSLWALGLQHQDWSADYKLHARARWDPNALFQPVLERAAPLCPGPFLVMALDDTRIPKTGRKIMSAFYQRDPLSPKFRFNLMWGLRFLHVSLLVPLYRSFPDASPRSLPLRFHEVPALKKPGKKATDEQRRAYVEAVQRHNLSQHSLTVLEGLRRSADQAALNQRLIWPSATIASVIAPCFANLWTASNFSRGRAKTFDCAVPRLPAAVVSTIQKH